MVPYRPINTLKPVAEQVWLVDGGVIGFRCMGVRLPFPTRMTIVRLADGGLWVHSPTELTAELRPTVAALGPVRHLIAPNRLHYWWIADWQRAFPRGAGLRRAGRPQGRGRARRTLRARSRRPARARLGRPDRPAPGSRRLSERGGLLPRGLAHADPHRPDRELRGGPDRKPLSAPCDPARRLPAPRRQDADRPQDDLPRPSARAPAGGRDHARLAAGAGDHRPWPLVSRGRGRRAEARLPLARPARLRRAGRPAQVASRTAERNWRVRSFWGSANSWPGAPCSAILPW